MSVGNESNKKKEDSSDKCPPELRGIVTDALFRGEKKVMIIVENGDAIYVYGVGMTGASERIGMIEAARTIEQAQLYRDILKLTKTTEKPAE